MQLDLILVVFGRLRDKNNAVAVGCQLVGRLLATLFVKEAERVIESNLFAPAAQLKYRENVVGFQLVGDQLQQKPTSASGDGTPMIQEFGPQMKMSYLERWVNVRLPTAMLDCQTRMDYEIARFPNAFTYNGKCKYSDIGDGAPRSLDIWEALATIINSPCFEGWTANIHNPWSEVCINTPNSTAIRDKVTLSRYNVKHVKMSAMIVKVLFEQCQKVLKDLKIQAPYESQVNKLRAGIRKLYKILPGKPLMESLGIDIRIFDSMRGREALYVITDFTNSDELGFLDKDNIINTAITRAKRLHIVITDWNLMKGRKTTKEIKKLHNGDHFESHPPEILTYHKHLDRANVVFDIDTDEFPALMADEDVDEDADDQYDKEWSKDPVDEVLPTKSDVGIQLEGNETRGRLKQNLPARFKQNLLPEAANADGHGAEGATSTGMLGEVSNDVGGAEGEW